MSSNILNSSITLTMVVLSPPGMISAWHPTSSWPKENDQPMQLKCEGNEGMLLFWIPCPPNNSRSETPGQTNKGYPLGAEAALKRHGQHGQHHQDGVILHGRGEERGDLVLLTLVFLISLHVIPVPQFLRVAMCSAKSPWKARNQGIRGHMNEGSGRMMRNPPTTRAAASCCCEPRFPSPAGGEKKNRCPFLRTGDSAKTLPAGQEPQWSPPSFLPSLLPRRNLPVLYARLTNVKPAPDPDAMTALSVPKLCRFRFHKIGSQSRTTAP